SPGTSTLSLHDALPISNPGTGVGHCPATRGLGRLLALEPEAEHVEAPGGRPADQWTHHPIGRSGPARLVVVAGEEPDGMAGGGRSEEHTSELQSRENLV